VSVGVADDLAETIAFPRHRITVVYNPIVTAALIARSHETIAHPWLVPGAPPVILAVGRLTLPKDFPTLIRAFARLRAGRSARLVILGEGELRDELEALVAELGLTADVALPGFTDNPFSWMRRSALFVLSSAWEGLPTVLVEAMACGTPVVSTDCRSGPAEILEGGKWGRLAPVKDVEALAAAMATTLEETEHPDVAQRALDFGVDRAVDGYLQAVEHPSC
jgi:glycosyltransferase involved in cell wall biosynthesis